MVDCLVGNKEHTNDDDKEIDHIYVEDSLFEAKLIYYIGDIHIERTYITRLQSKYRIPHLKNGLEKIIYLRACVNMGDKLKIQL